MSRSRARQIRVIRRFLALVCAAWVIVAAASAAHAAMFLADHAQVFRVERGTLVPLASIEQADHVAAASHGGAWVSADKRLMSIARDGSMRKVADLAEDQWGHATHLIADPYDDSVWLATDTALLLHVAASGDLLYGTTLDAPVDAIGVAADQSVWATAGGALFHFSRAGQRLETRALFDGLAPTMLAVDSLRERVWIATSEAIYRVPMLAFSPPEPVVRGNIGGFAVAVRSGDLWSIVDASVLVVDGSDETLHPVDLPAPSDARHARALAYDADEDAIIIQATHGLLRAAAPDRIVERWMNLDTTVIVASSPRIEPQIALIRPPDGAAVLDEHAALVLQLGMRCNAAPCGAGVEHWRGASIEATLNGEPIAGPLVEASGRVALHASPPLRIGSNRLRARVVDRFGHVAAMDAHVTLLSDSISTDAIALPESGAGSVPKAANKPPSVQLTSPTPGTTYTAAASIALEATAADSDGSIAKVEFYRSGSVLLGTATSAPYRFVWANAPVGNHSLTAKAYDNRNGSANSPSVAISVVANRLPTVAVTSPANDEFLAAGSPIVLSATATDPDGTIAAVEFLAGTAIVGSIATPPYRIEWTAPAGTYSIIARATDDRGGHSDSIPVRIVVGDPPLVVVTQPIACALVDGPTDVELAADAISTSGRISKVDFYDGAVFIGTVTAAPWRMTLVNAAAGSHSIAARAIDDHGVAATSRYSSFTVHAPNEPPTISLVSPAEGARFPFGATVTLTATATDRDDAVVSVEYRTGAASGTLIGRAVNAPYAVSWSGMPAGSYTVVAIARDERGASTTSTPVHVTVDPNAPPTVALTSPAAGASFTAPATISLAASAADSDGSVAKVEFYAGAALVGSATAAPYAATWRDVPKGTYVLTAKATDDVGATATSAPMSVAVIDNAPPIVALAPPAPSGPYFAPASIHLAASASDPDGSVAKVDFYVDGTLIGTATSSPYAILWNDAGGGTHSIAAIATDDRGAATASVSIAITINATIALDITAGLEGSSVDDDRILVSGTLSAPPNSGVLVNGIIAQLDGSGGFYANGVALQPGDNAIPIALVAPSGQTATRTLTVSRSGTAPFELNAAPTDGIAPLTVLFAVHDRGSRSFRRMDFDFNADGTRDFTVSSTQFVNGDAVVATTYPEGTYKATVTAYDDHDSPIWSAEPVITVRALERHDAQLRAVYLGMIDSLRSGRIDLALDAITGDAQDRYAAVFAELGAGLPAAIDTLGTLQPHWFGIDRAEYLLVRDTPQGPQAFLIDFIRGEDGVWRIDAM